MSRILFEIVNIAFVLFMLVVGWSIADNILDSTYGEYTTNIDWIAAEQAYCQRYGLTAIEYISTECMLFGCSDFEKTKCVGTNTERKIDYDDKSLCKLTLKGDYGWC